MMLIITPPSTSDLECPATIRRYRSGTGRGIESRRSKSRNQSLKKRRQVFTRTPYKQPSVVSEICVEGLLVESGQRSKDVLERGSGLFISGCLFQRPYWRLELSEFLHCLRQFSKM